MNSRTTRVMALSLSLAAAACSGKKEASNVVETQPATASQGTLASVDQRVAANGAPTQLKDLATLVDLIVAEASDLPRVDFDPAVLAAKLGKDPQAHFEWVRDQTWWAPYRGLLRGSRGVMLDRVGSSLDRAVLLADLLRHAGYTVRLAQATLPEARARELLDKVRPIPAQRRKPTASRAMPQERLRSITALVPDFTQEMDKQLAESRRVKAEADALVRSQSGALLTTVHETARPEVSSEESEAIAALRDHWWVEREEGGKWLAMDLLLPEAKSGEALTDASHVSEWKAGDLSPAVPESEWHTVRLRVVVERYEAGATTESTVLETVLRPAELFERQVTLGHMPVPWPSDLRNPTDTAVLREAALGVREWIPYLRVGRDQIAQSSFNIEGDIKANPADSLRSIKKVGGAEVAGGIDTALGGFGGDEVVPVATAEWLDYEVRVPGAAVERLRRPVFDLLGPARRASKATDFAGAADLPKLERFEALWGETDILLQASAFTPEFVDHLTLSDFVENQDALRELSKQSDPARIRQLASAIVDRMSPWGPLPNLVLWRSLLAGPDADGYLDRPNVLNYRVSKALLNVDKPTFRQLIDVASNATGVRRGAGGTSFETRMRQGVADTVAEMLALGSDLRASENTASIFAQLAADGSRGLLIAARDHDAVQALPWPEDEAMRVGADVNAGFMAVVPRKAVLLAGEQRVGWWRVDPSSGETIGVMDSGYHAISEDAVQRALAYLRANVGYMRTVVQNPNAFPNATVQMCRAGLKTLMRANSLGM